MTRSVARGLARPFGALGFGALGLGVLGFIALGSSALGLLLVGVVPAQAADRVVQTEFRIAGTPEPDGAPVQLDLTLRTTDPAVPRPAVVLAHGFGGTKADSADAADALARSGYTVLTYTARGFGRSGGLIHLDHPDFEGADASRVVDFAAGRPEVQRSGADDPVLGFAGASYGGAVALLAAARDPRIDAVVPMFTWHSLPQALFPQHAVTGDPRSLADVPATSGAGVFKQRWAALLFSGATAGRDASSADAPDPSSDPVCGRFTPALCTAYRRAAETGEPNRGLLDLLAESSPAGRLGRVTAPTLIVAGENDTLFGLDQADAIRRGLPASTTARMTWVVGGHDGGIDLDQLLPEIEDWFGTHLRGESTPPEPPFSVAVPQTSLVGQAGDREPQTVSASGYPGVVAGITLNRTRQSLTGEQQRVVSPPGGRPGALTGLPGTGGLLTQVSSLAGYPLAVLPGQSATFTSAVLTEPLDLIGSGRVRLRVSSSRPEATLFVTVWDLGPNADTVRDGRPVRGPSTAVLPQLAVAPVRLTGLRPGETATVEVALPPVVHQVPVGHRLQLVVASTDQAYATPTRPAVYQIGLADPALDLPQLSATPVDADRLDVPRPLVVVVAALLLAAAGIAVGAAAGRRTVHPRAELVDVPLVVDRVAKTYADGFRAVDEVSFRAEPGQVVGLLGPNGAGKTTVMRMLVGLIRPDTGSVFVAGRPVTAGADVLGSVGAFIEGPGFLPHLSGEQNLLAYWDATGRPRAEAHLEEALAVAGLGEAVHRRVRGYSQGMRQRLAIAQAMLGLPRLLILDEPTNGLDPPQIKAMRAVLTDYAAAGRTVLISSHLLSEVEHTCSHVVVMHRGRVVVAGPLAELTAADGVTLVGLAASADTGAALAALAELGLRAEVEDDRIRVTGPRDRAAIIAGLVAAGVALESVEGRRQLEDVFLGLVGASTGATDPADG